MDALDGGDEPDHLVQQANLVTELEVRIIDDLWLRRFWLWLGEINFPAVHHLHNLLEVKIAHILRGNLLLLNLWNRLLNDSVLILELLDWHLRSSTHHLLYHLHLLLNITAEMCFLFHLLMRLVIHLVVFDLILTLSD